MKLNQPTQLMDMTNIIREYINRKKPVRKQLSKCKIPSIVIDLQNKKRATSTFKSYSTIQIRPRAPYRERLLSKELQTKQSKEVSRSTSHQIRVHIESHLQAETQAPTQKPISIKPQNSEQPQLQPHAFRIVKPKNKLPSSRSFISAPKRHILSVQDSTKASSKLIRHRYWIQSTLRRGLNSTVYKCKDTLKQSQTALKMFNSVAQTSQLKILKYLDHPNLIKYQNYFIDDNNLYFTMQLYQSNLLQFISSTKQLSRQTIKDIFKQICQGINHLHNSDYAHTNLKLQHILVTRTETLPKIVIIDFSHLTRSKNDEKVPRKEVVRNPSYASPELVENKAYSPKAVDCWALGVILYGLLTERLPFRSKELFELERKIVNGKLCFPKNVNDEERQLIRGILNVDEKKRLKIREILDSKWLN